MDYSNEFKKHSWHDNPIHSFRVIEKKHGVGDLILDIDYITEWLSSEDDKYNFKIAPTDLIFEDISDLEISLDYKSCSAGITPPSIHEIRREPKVYKNGYKSFDWYIEINWPSNCYIKFSSPSFKQKLRKKPILSDKQIISSNTR